MFNSIIGLDHASIAVRDLDAAAESFRRLGFALTPKGHHAEWGTANHCAMFAQDYLQLLAAEGAGEQADRVRAFTRDREGILSLSLGTEDGAAAAEALRRAGLDVPQPDRKSTRLNSSHRT